MYNIGIISNRKKSGCCSIIQNFLMTNNCTHITVQDLNVKSNIDEIDLFVCEKPPLYAERIFKNIENSIIIVNNDDETTNALVNFNLCVLTCGLSYKSTVTTSSVEDNIYTFCLQRNIPTLSGSKVSAQEFNLQLSTKQSTHADFYPVLASATALLVCNVPNKILKNFMF